jgi:hypothetical protein
MERDDDIAEGKVRRHHCDDEKLLGDVVLDHSCCKRYGREEG